MKQIRCRKCRHFFDTALAACDECGTERHAYNTHLYSSKLNQHLYGMAEHGPAREKAAAFKEARKITGEVFA